MWLALAVHFAAGVVSIVAGTIALSVTKGGRFHKKSGLVFTSAMTTVKSLPGIGRHFNVALMVLVLAFAPILFLIYWMWRVRVRGRMSGVILGNTQPH